MREFVRTIPLLEAAALAVFLGYLVWAWRGVTLQQETSDQKRGVSASAVSSAISGALTASSIMLSGTLIGLRAAAPLSGATRRHIEWAVVFAVLSLIAGAVNMAYLPARVSRYDVATDKTIAVLGGIELFFMVVAGLRIVAAVFSVMGSLP